MVPEGSMLNPRTPAAVVAGNVETSQVVTDALYSARWGHGRGAGTMNNFTFGDAAHQYYETIAGGRGQAGLCRGQCRCRPYDQQPADRPRKCWRRAIPCCWKNFRCGVAQAAWGSGGRAAMAQCGLVRFFSSRWRPRCSPTSARCRPLGLAGGGDGAPAGHGGRARRWPG